MKIVAKLNVRYYVVTFLLAAMTIFAWYGIYFLNVNRILMEDGKPMTAEYKFLFTIALCLITLSWTVSLVNMIRQIVLGYAYTADKDGIYNTLTASVIFALIFVVPIKKIPKDAILEITKSDSDTFAAIDKSKVVTSRPFRLFLRKEYHFFFDFTKTPPDKAVALFKNKIIIFFNPKQKQRNNMQKILSRVRAACEKYNMIDDGDNIAVGVSGGKDSIMLLIALAELRRFYGKKFDVTAITMDPCFNGEECDYSKIENLCKQLNVEYHIKRTSLWEVIFVNRKETNPCSLCARMRRGILHDLAKEYGCNKIALGHHLDDAAETFFMNLMRCATVSCFSPVSYLSRKDLYLIRPLVLTHESMITATAEKFNIPVVKSKCPADGCTARQDMKEQIKEWEKQFPGLRDNIIGAMQRAKISGWEIEK